MPVARASSSIAAGRERPYVVVGVDTSDSARHALLWAVGYAELARGTVVAVSALPELAPSYVDPPEALEALERTAVGAKRDALDRLEAVVTDVLTDSSRVVCAALAGGVADVLIEVSSDADLLVVGSTPRGALGRALLSSLRPARLSQASCPVVLVRAPA